MLESSDSKTEFKNLTHPPLPKKIIYTLFALFLPKPFEQDDMEFMHGAWQGSSTATCKDGRPLGEDNALPVYHQSFADTYYRIANFKDARKGKYYNITALHHMMKDWRDIMSLYSHLRKKYIKIYTPEIHALTLFDLFIFSKLTVAVPAYLIRSNHHKIQNGDIPPLLASQTKLVTGLFMVVRKMVEMGESFLNDANPADTNHLYNYTTKHRLLISPRDKDFVCAGSEKMIRELMKITINGYDKEKINQKIIHESLSTIGDLETCFIYGMLDLQMELTIKRIQVHLLKAIFSKSVSFNNSQNEYTGLETHIRTNFNEEFYNVEKLSIHEKHLISLLGKTKIEPLSITLQDDFTELYGHSLNELSTWALQQQNKINELLGRKKLKNISSKKLQKRLNIVPKHFFSRYN